MCIINIENENHKVVATEKLKINHSLGKAEWFVFYCCLINIIAKAIINATFMIASPIIP